MYTYGFRFTSLNNAKTLPYFTDSAMIHAIFHPFASSFSSLDNGNTTFYLMDQTDLTLKLASSHHNYVKKRLNKFCP